MTEFVLSFSATVRSSCPTTDQPGRFDSKLNYRDARTWAFQHAALMTTWTVRALGPLASCSHAVTKAVRWRTCSVRFRSVDAIVMPVDSVDSDVPASTSQQNHKLQCVPSSS